MVRRIGGAQPDRDRDRQKIVQRRPRREGATARRPAAPPAPATMRMEPNPVGPRSGEQEGGSNTLETAAWARGSTAVAVAELAQQPELALTVTGLVEPAPEPEPMQNDYNSVEQDRVEHRQSKCESELESDHVELEPDPKPEPVEREPEPELARATHCACALHLWKKNVRKT